MKQFEKEAEVVRKYREQQFKRKELPPTEVIESIETKRDKSKRFTWMDLILTASVFLLLGYLLFFLQVIWFN